MKRFYCTYFDREQLIKAVALIEALKRHEQQEHTLFALCLDEESISLVRRLALDNVIPLGLEDVQLEAPDQDEPTSAEPSRQAIIPTLALAVLERLAEGAVLTYVDATVFIYSSLDPLYEELGEGSVLIHESRLSQPELSPSSEVCSKYGTGLICFRNDDPGRQAASAWRDDLLYPAVAADDDEGVTMAGCLDDWPSRFEGVVELTHIGEGLAPWNHDQLQLSRDESGQVLADGVPVVSYHFWSLTFGNPGVIVPVGEISYPLTTDILRLLVLPYLYALQQAITLVRQLEPEFRAGLYSKEILTAEHTFVATRKLAAALERRVLAQTVRHLDDQWDCYQSEQLIDAFLESETASEPPDSSVPPPDSSAPPPDSSVPPPGSSVPPPDSSVPPPGASVPPPGASVPPPGVFSAALTAETGLLAPAEASRPLLSSLSAKGLWGHGRPLRLRLCVDGSRLDGYLSINGSRTTGGAEHSADLTALQIPNETIDELRVERVLELCELVQSLALIICWQLWLKPGCELHLRTLDFEACARGAIDGDSSSGQLLLSSLFGSPAAPLRDGWYPTKLTWVLYALGFGVDELSSEASAEGLPMVHAVAVKHAHLGHEHLLASADDLLDQVFAASADAARRAGAAERLRRLVERGRGRYGS